MSAELLRSLVEADALKPPVDWRGLAAAHVDFDELNQTDEFETRLAHNALRDRDASIVLGGAGSGKSSMIAGVAERTSTERWVVRVQGKSGDDLLTREGFARHIANEALRALSQDHLAPQIRARGAKRRLADTRKVTRGGHTAGTQHTQIRSAAEEVTSSRSASDLYAALDELSEVSAKAGRPMLLVVEDTEVFMPPHDLSDDEAEGRAARFISQVLPFLAREIRAPSLVAVPLRYEQLVSKYLGATVHVSAVPQLVDPVAALRRIMASQARRHGLYTEPHGVIEEEALEWLARRLEGGADLRSVLRAIYDGAVKTAREDEAAGRISLAAVMAQF